MLRILQRMQPPEDSTSRGRSLLNETQLTDRNDSSDAEEILNVYLCLLEQGQARIRKNNGQRRQIELMCEENRVSW